ncbi:hypothetical protein M3Y97_00252600 [Aphelenchoides bicaudatus]|nr:hypothetical protein M3Y97_00252600 [Aphelenchoides bicaudatus]
MLARCLRICVLAGCTFLISDANRAKRQSSIDDLIHTALSFVRPIFDTTQVIQDSPVIPRKISMTEHAGRETEILGAPKYSNVMEVPICKGNSQICHFISCTAHNFKQDENFANLNLAAQLLEDKKMRQTIMANPETVVSVCHEQGLSIEQCRLFSRGFQLIGRFMNNIEQPMNSPLSNALNDADKDNVDLKPVEVESPAAPPKQHLVNLSIPRSAQLGSQTWSTKRRVFDNPKPIKQVIKHSTTNRSQPLGLTDAPPQQRRPKNPPKAQKPPSSSQAVHVRTSNQKHVRTKDRTYHTTERQKTRVPPRPKKLPELEEEEEDYGDYSESEESLARSKRQAFRGLLR